MNAAGLSAFSMAAVFAGLGRSESIIAARRSAYFLFSVI
jgi:hypothetical protein